MRGLREWFAAWRRTPRRTLRRWDLPRGHLESAFALLVLPWAFAIGLLTNAAEATSVALRAWFVAAALPAVAAGVAGAVFVVAYLRRPVLDEPPPQPVSADETARAESEQRAWRSR